MPVCRPLRGGLYEVRTTLKGRIARVIFCFRGGKMILLHGFIKKDRKTPKPEFDIALKRKQNMEAEE
jgi:phage-related protein